MIPYHEGLKHVLDAVSRMESEQKPLLEALGQVLAEDVHAPCDLPRAALGGPDGYAVRLEDIRTASRETPVTLRIAGTVRAGQVPKKRVEPGSAIRTMTGSVLPEGADCVIRFEDTDEPDDKNGPNLQKPKEVRIFVPGPQGPSSITRPGAQITNGTLAVPKGTIIGPPVVSVLGQLGRLRVKVHRRPVIAILSSGDELLPPGRPLAPGRIHDCNSGAMAAYVRHYGGIPKLLGIARDREASIIAKLARGLSADAIITTGGVSKGDYDLTRIVIGKLGRMVFSRIRMAPGGAVAFALLEDRASRRQVPMFALSGPPMGCLVNFETLVRPALLKMLGREDVDHPAVTAKAKEAIPDPKGMAFVKWTKVSRTGLAHQVDFDPGGKGMILNLARANSITIIPAQTAIDTENPIEVLPLDWCHQ
jgi:molybdopterin molybdotransferase